MKPRRKKNPLYFFSAWMLIQALVFVQIFPSFVYAQEKSTDRLSIETLRQLEMQEQKREEGLAPLLSALRRRVTDLLNPPPVPAPAAGMEQGDLLEMDSVLREEVQKTSFNFAHAKEVLYHLFQRRTWPPIQRSLGYSRFEILHEREEQVVARGKTNTPQDPSADLRLVFHREQGPQESVLIRKVVDQNGRVQFALEVNVRRSAHSRRDRLDRAMRDLLDRTLRLETGLLRDVFPIPGLAVHKELRAKGQTLEDQVDRARFLREVDVDKWVNLRGIPSVQQTTWFESFLKYLRQDPRRAEMVLRALAVSHDVRDRQFFREQIDDFLEAFSGNDQVAERLYSGLNQPRLESGEEKNAIGRLSRYVAETFWNMVRFRLSEVANRLPRSIGYVEPILVELSTGLGYPAAVSTRVLPHRREEVIVDMAALVASDDLVLIQAQDAGRRIRLREKVSEMKVSAVAVKNFPPRLESQRDYLIRRVLAGAVFLMGQLEQFRSLGESSRQEVLRGVLSEGAGSFSLFQNPRVYRQLLNSSAINFEGEAFWQAVDVLADDAMPDPDVRGMARLLRDQTPFVKGRLRSAAGTLVEEVRANIASAGMEQEAATVTVAESLVTYTEAMSRMPGLMQEFGEFQGFQFSEPATGVSGFVADLTPAGYEIAAPYLQEGTHVVVTADGLVQAYQLTGLGTEHLEVSVVDEEVDYTVALGQAVRSVLSTGREKARILTGHSSQTVEGALAASGLEAKATVVPNLTLKEILSNLGAVVDRAFDRFFKRLYEEARQIIQFL